MGPIATLLGSPGTMALLFAGDVAVLLRGLSGRMIVGSRTKPLLTSREREAAS